MFKLNNVPNIICTVIFIKIFGDSWANECNTSQLILSYAPMNDSHEMTRGQIVIYWFVKDFKQGDYLILYHDTADSFFTYSPNEGSGFVKTGIAPVDARYSIESMYIDQCSGNSISSYLIIIYNDNFLT